MPFGKAFQWRGGQEVQVVKKMAKENKHLSRSDSFTHLDFANDVV